MATDPETSAEPDPRGSNALYAYAVWLIVGFGCYAGPISLLIVDHFVFNDQLIEKPLRALSPDLHDRVGESFRFIYWPPLQIMRQLKILPG